MAPPSNSPENDVKTVNDDVLMDWQPPKAQGLYDPQNEHEACGVGFIVAIDGKRNHKVMNFPHGILTFYITPLSCATDKFEKKNY